MTIFLALKHLFTTKEVVAIFIKEVVKLHGLSRSIISDRDFVGNFWVEMFKLQGIELKKSTTFHPQIDGKTK